MNMQVQSDQRQHTASELPPTSYKPLLKVSYPPDNFQYYVFQTHRSSSRAASFTWVKYNESGISPRVLDPVLRKYIALVISRFPNASQVNLGQTLGERHSPGKICGVVFWAKIQQSKATINDFQSLVQEGKSKSVIGKKEIQKEVPWERSDSTF